MPFDPALLTRFHRVLVQEIREHSPEYLSGEFTVAEIYQKLVPYGVHRSRLGVEMNADYEDALLRLLGGEGDYLRIQSDPARQRIRRELESSNPNTGIYREFAAVGVRLNPERTPDAPEPTPDRGEGSRRRSEAEGAQDAPGGGDAAVGVAPPGPQGPHLFEMVPSQEKGEAPPPAMTALPRSRRGAEAAQAPSPSGTSKGAHLPEECPGCSEILPQRDSLRFCPYCGVNVLERGCPACGEPLEWSWAFCVACGTQVDEG